MQSRHWMWGASLYILMCAVFPVTGHTRTRKPIVAVFDIEDRGAGLKQVALRNLSDYLADKLAATGAYQVVPRDQLKKRLVVQKLQSYKQCHDQTCQIEIGKQLAAQKTLATKVMNIGVVCTVTSTLYDLRKAASEQGATVKGKCSASSIMASIDKVIAKLATWTPLVESSPAPVESSPQVSGGAITQPVARLIIQVRPTVARVKVTGPDGFSATSGANWEMSDLKPGAYVVMSVAAGYVPSRRTLTLEPDDLQTVKIKLKRPGTLEVVGSPAGTRVQITGPGGLNMEKGLPVTVSGAQEGTYQVRLNRKGYKTEDHKVKVQPGRSTRVEVLLKKASASAAAMNRGRLQWVTIPGGSFMMGSNFGSRQETPVHHVTVKPFQLSKTEVTLGQYRACEESGNCTMLRKRRSLSRGLETEKLNASRPVTGVDWKTARVFCTWAGGGRLPSEAEWEYAARSGGKTRSYPWGEEEASCARAVISVGGRAGCGRAGIGRSKRPFPVCSKTSGNTTHGLCDMVGNVAEWVEDCWHNNYQGAPSNGSAWSSGGNCRSGVLRGGSYYDGYQNLIRATSRKRATARFSNTSIGFRCARSIK